MSPDPGNPVGGRVLLKAEKLTKTFRVGGQWVCALNGVSITVNEGEFVAIMGPSGSGKSTLMNILGCLDFPSSGRYTLAGELITSEASQGPAEAGQALSSDALASVRNRLIGFVFQQFNLLPRTSALENVELPMVYANVPPPERRARALEALRRVGLSDRASHAPSELSGGQQQRVAIARALVNRPRLILADEPTGALDSRTSEDIMALLAELNQQGITVILVTHEIDMAAWARRRVVFKDGLIVEDVMQTPRTAAPKVSS